MKNILGLILVLSSFFVNAQWEDSFETAQKIALGTNRFILVDFTAKWCGPCRQMDLKSWTDDEVKTLTQDFVMLKIDIDYNKDFAYKYAVNSIPNMFILDANGKKLISFNGYHSPLQLKNILTKYLLSSQYISNDLMYVYKTNNFINTIRLVQKYFDFCLLVNKDIKNDILNLGTSYLDRVEKKFDKNDINYVEYKQKLELIKLFTLAYNFKYKKIEEKLAKDFSNENLLLENNKSMYLFLKYLSLAGLKSDEANNFKSNFLSSNSYEYLVAKVANVISNE